MTKAVWFTGAVLAAALIVPAFAQQSASPPHDHQSAAPAAAQHSMMMGDDHQRMMSEMKASGERIQELVAKMKTNTGDQKVSVMAELLEQLAANQITMQSRMAECSSQMMMRMPSK